MSSVGAVGAGGAAGAAGAGASGGGGSVSGSSGASAAGEAASVGEAAPVGKGESTEAVEKGGMINGSQGLYGPQMSSQDFCALRTQAATPTQEAPEIDLNKMLEWLMAIKLLEAANGGEK